MKSRSTFDMLKTWDKCLGQNNITSFHSIEWILKKERFNLELTGIAETRHRTQPMNQRGLDDGEHSIFHNNFIKHKT